MADEEKEIEEIREDKRWGHILRIEKRVKELESTLRTLAGTFHSIVHSGPEGSCEEAICKTTRRVLSQSVPTWDDQWGWMDQQVVGVDKPYSFFQPDPYEESIDSFVEEVKPRRKDSAWDEVVDLARSIKVGEQARIVIGAQKGGKKRTRLGVYRYVWGLMEKNGLRGTIKIKVSNEVDGNISVLLTKGVALPSQP